MPPAASDLLRARFFTTTTNSAKNVNRFLVRNLFFLFLADSVAMTFFRLKPCPLTARIQGWR